MLTDEDLWVKKDPVAWLIMFSLAFYVGSFVMPTYGSDQQRHLYGWQAFLISLPALFDNGKPYWLANSAYWTALLLCFCGRTKAAFPVLSILAFALALSVLFLFPVHDLAELLIGYYVWLSGNSLLAAAASVSVLRQRYFRRVAPRRLRPKQFTLRVLFVMTGFVAVMLAFVVIPINRVHQQRKVVSTIRLLNGQVTYDPTSQSPPRSRFHLLARSIYGEDVFRYVIRVNVGGSGKTVDDSDLQILASLQSLESLSIENAQLSVFGADGLSKLRSLKFLTISDSVVAEGTFERLKRCPALRELTLRGVPLSRNLLEELASLHSVKVNLSLTSTLSTEEMSILARSQNIHTLTFDRVRVPRET